MRWIIGVDEAGRGPLAGPIAVGAVAIPVERNDWRHWDCLKDSKQLTELARETWFEKMKRDGVRHAVALVGAPTIDSRGITYAAALAARRAICALAIAPEKAEVLLDWGLQAPFSYRQEWLVKGDENVPAIALASVAAKVTRDWHMARMAKKFPAYGFEQHKGYGTRAHYERLDLYGPCTLHRRTFLHM